MNQAPDISYMLFYIFVFFLLLAFKCITKKDLVLGKIIFIFLFVLSAFRGPNVGDDTINYFFNDLQSADFDINSNVKYSFEITYQYVSRMIYFLGLPSNCIIFFLSFITFYFLDLSARRLKINLTDISFYYYATLLFFISLNISRQMAAVSVVLLAYTYLIDKNEKKRFFFFPLMLFAASIHISAIIFMAIYLLRYLPEIRYYDKKILVFTCFVALFLLLMASKERILETLVPYLAMWELYDNESLTYISLSDTTIVSFIVHFSKLIINVSVLLWLNKTNQNKVLQHLFFITIIASILFAVIVGNMLRLLYYLQIVCLIAYSLFFSYDRIRKNKKAQLLFLYFILVSFVHIFACLRGDTYQIIPYYFFF